MPLRDPIETIAKDLRDPAFALEFLQMGWDDGMPTFLVSLRDVIQANDGMARIAEATGLSRESLYKALSATGNPHLSTVRKIMQALGYDFAPMNRFAAPSKDVTLAETAI